MRDTISNIALLIVVLIALGVLVVFLISPYGLFLLMGLVYFGLWAGSVWLGWQIGGFGLALLAAIVYPVLLPFIISRFQK